MRVVIYIGAELAQDIFVKGSVYIFFQGCSEDFHIFFLLEIHCSYIVISNIVLMMYIYDEVVIIVLSSIFTCVVSFLSLCTCFLLIVCNILYFCFTLRCRDEFCLKCFRNTGCQSLLAINSLLAKFFESLCQDKFYCIQQMSMS